MVMMEVGLLELLHGKDEVVLRSQDALVLTNELTSSSSLQVVDADQMTKDQDGDKQIGEATCTTCRLVFENVAEQRAHFKTDWHRLNLKRKEKGKAPLAEADADKLLDDPNGDLESLSASDTDEDEFEEDDEEDNEEGGEQDGKGHVVQKGTILAGLLVDRKGENMIAWCPKAVVLSADKEHMDLEILKSRPLWLVLLYRSGHFAGVVFDTRTRKAVTSKSFHRYVIRQKQGKAQSSNDNAKGKAKSAGAQIRRYNEQMLKEEIGEILLDKWLHYIEQCSRVFISVSKTNQRLFFQDDKVLSSKDPRVRRIPFPTKRPTVKEATMIGARLCTVHLENESDFQDRKRQEEELLKKKKPVVIASPPRPPVNKNMEETSLESEAEEDLPAMLNFLEACKSGNMASLILEIGLNPDTIFYTSPPNEGQTGLHLAASGDHGDLVQTLLENGANPCICDLRGRLPYHCATSKSCRDVFRRFMGANPDRWNYDNSGIPSPLTDESEQAKKQKQRDKKKRQKERKKLEAEKQKKEQERLLKKQEEEEKAMLAAAKSCETCQKKLLGKPSTWFHRMEWSYCSTDCMQTHRRKLAAEAAEKRFAK